MHPPEAAPTRWEGFTKPPGCMRQDTPGIALRNRKLLKTKWLHFNHFQVTNHSLKNSFLGSSKSRLVAHFERRANSWGTVDLSDNPRSPIRIRRQGECPGPSVIQ